MWFDIMKTLPIASQEVSGALEVHHVKLKVKPYGDSHLGAVQRVGGLAHKLIAELHSSYWLDLHDVVLSRGKFQCSFSVTNLLKQLLIPKSQSELEMPPSAAGYFLEEYGEMDSNTIRAAEKTASTFPIESENEEAVRDLFSTD